MQFINSIPTESVMTGMLRKQNRKEFNRRSTGIFLRPTKENQFYRLRLLNFPPNPEFVEKAGITQARDFPFILRYSHVIWQRTPDENAPNGVRISTKSIPCPQSDYIQPNSNLTGRMCPICQAYNQAWSAFKDSNYKNAVAKEKLGKCKNVFEALIPVYVITDPTYESNNGSVKVLTLNKEQYERLINAIRDAGKVGIPVWNENAVDLYISYGKCDKVRPGKNGNPDYHFTANDIIKIGFTQTPHTVPDLEAQIENLQFDENWFIVPTLAELQDFYAKYIAAEAGIPNDIPNDIPVSSTPSAKPAQTPPPVVETDPAAKKQGVPPMDIPDDIPSASAATATPSAQTVPEQVADAKPSEQDVAADIDSFLANLQI